MLNNIDEIKQFFTPQIYENKDLHKNMLKEYLECMVLDFISKQPEAKKLVFIGGTCLRLVYNINRFSEDLDFDNNDLSYDEFINLTDRIVVYLNKQGYNVTIKEKESDNIIAYRRSIYFPKLLFELGISGLVNQKFLLKIESQDQKVDYVTETKVINKCGFRAMLNIPKLDVLCGMKALTVLTRSKGRDFYDLLFLYSMTKPNMGYIKSKSDIKTLQELNDKIIEKAEEVNIGLKSKDFKHLVIDDGDTEKVAKFSKYLW